MTTVREGMKRGSVRAPGWRVAALVAAGVACAVCLVTGCSLDGLLKSDELPPNVTDPAITQTPEGALAAYQGTLAVFRKAVGGDPGPGRSNTVASSAFPIMTGLLTDELLAADPSGGGSFVILLPQDLRSLPEFASQTDGAIGTTYNTLNQVRSHAAQAVGLLTRYRPNEPALASHLYALEGYAEVFLAELFCSGIPLSTLDYNGDFTYRAGSSTEEVFRHAAALFDTALATAGDSARFLQLARVGRARALLAMGDYAAAAAVAALVPDDYSYAVRFNTENNALNFGYFADAFWGFTVADQEGINGLAYRTSGDPRTAATTLGTNSAHVDVYYPNKYTSDGTSPVVLASGVEARLIQAEAALQANPNDGVWLATLNTLRTDGTMSSGVDTNTIADTLGVTGCGPDSDHWCGNAPESDDPEQGVVNGYFQVPDGYTLTATEVIKPVPAELQSTCFNYSWYLPCWNGDSTLVRKYFRPAEAPTWRPGTGGVAGLAPLDDPGTAAGRVDLLFRERAFWLFLTGHRQGDLRRLIRQYERTEEQVYPVGSYPFHTPGGIDNSYGSDVTAPIPTAERTLNPHFTSCASRDA